MVIVIYGKSGAGVWRALCALKGCSSALLRVAALKGSGTEAGALEDSKNQKSGDP
jgi:hypothetical protein